MNTKADTPATRLILCLLVASLIAAAAALDATASRSTSAVSGVIHVFETSTGPSSAGNVVITGAINDAGNGTTCPRGTVCGTIGNGKIVLANGSIEDTASAAIIGRQKDLFGGTVNPPSCTLVGTISGPVNITGGTGAYAGISGTLNATYTVAAVLHKLPNGNCNTSHGTRPVGAVIYIKASGMIRAK